MWYILNYIGAIVIWLAAGLTASLTLKHGLRKDYPDFEFEFVDHLIFFLVSLGGISSFAVVMVFEDVSRVKYNLKHKN